jgi:hypothetical protein
MRWSTRWACHLGVALVRRQKRKSCSIWNQSDVLFAEGARRRPFLPRRIFLQKPIGKFVLQLLVYYKGECKWETKQTSELIDDLTNKSL